MPSPTWEYLHILTNPFAVVLTVAGAGVGLSGWIARRGELERWGVIAALLAGIMAIPAYVTGLTAADVAAARTFVEPSLLQSHRAWATWTTVLLVSQGVFAAFSLTQRDDRRLRRFVILVAVVGTGLVGWTAFLGGRIVHEPATDADRIRERAHARPESGQPPILRHSSTRPEARHTEDPA